MSNKKQESANPSQNLEVIAVVDQTTTKSDRKSGANIVEQSTNEENEIKKENSKSYIFSQLNDYLFGFNENEETAKLMQAVEMGFITSEEIPAIIAKRKKIAMDSANETTIEEFATKLDSFSRIADLKKVCGFATSTTTKLMIDLIVEADKCVIYHSFDEESEIKEGSKKSTFSTLTISKKDNNNNVISATIQVEKAEINSTNLVRAIRYYSVFQNANQRVTNAVLKSNRPAKDLFKAVAGCLSAEYSEEKIISLVKDAFRLIKEVESEIK